MTFQTRLKNFLPIAAIFLYTLTIPITAQGISCYKCIASNSGNEKTDLLCSQFDGSARFQVHCPSSTLCTKRSVYSSFKNSTITAIERDCALQKRTIPIYTNNQWENKDEIVTTAYEEGCFTGEDRGSPSGPPEYCFCSGHLCNSSLPFRVVHAYHIFLLNAILLIATSLR